MNDQSMTTRKPEISIRFMLEEDAAFLTEWLLQPEVLQYFPMYDVREVEDAVKNWISYSKIQSGLTAEWNGVPCGIANLNIMPYKKLAHQCLLSIVVDEKHRGKGVGTALLEDLMKLAKEKFNIELLHLEVYEHNPAVRLYKRLGFKEFGIQRHFIKED
ncbi:MAG TPA: N-acetyltransferase, partial [Rhabdochlamydiaceae bacterium]|nr:N-acetyltransferase [Rhabdochlamydiaceae bacterium]